MDPGDLALLAALHDPLPEAVYLMHADGRILYVNPAALALMNRSLDEVVGRHFNDFSPESFKAERLETHRRVMAGEEVRKRTTMHPPGLPVRTIEAVGRRLEWGGAPYHVAFVHDLTAQARAERALAETEERYRSVVDALEEGVLLVTADGKIAAANAAAARIVGTTTEELIRRTTTDGSGAAVREDGTPLPPEEYPVNVALRTGQVQVGRQYGIQRPDGTRAWVLVNARPLQRVSESSPYAAVVSMVDVTARREAERRLQAQHALLSVLARPEGPGEVLPRVLEAVGAALGWEAAVYWTADAEAGVLRGTHSWSAGAAELAEHLRPLLGRSIGRGEGLAGRVFVSGEALAGPGPAGLASAFAFPVRVAGAVVGVAAFFARGRQEADEELLRASRGLGLQIGQYLERRRVEETLRRREDHFRMLIENSSDSIAILDAAGRITYQSPAITRQLGYSIEEFTGINPFELIHDEDRERVFGIFREGLADPESVRHAEFRFRHKDGSWRHLETVAKAVHPEGQEPFAILNTRDVTERRRVEEALRASEERWRSLMLTIPDVVFTVDTSRRITFINRVVAGFRIEDVIGRLVLEYLPPEYHAEYMSHLDGVLLEGRSTAFETPAAGPNGSTAWYATRMSPILVGGRITGALVIATDVTTRREIIDRMRKMAEEQALVLSGTRDFLYRHDTRGVFTYVSPAVEAITGYSAADWMAHYTKYMTDSPLNAKVVAYTDETLKTGKQNPPYLVEVRHRDGRALLLEVSERAYQEGGAIAGIIGVARDVTDRERARTALDGAHEETRRALAELKRAQARLIQSEKLASVGMLVSGVAHEINNPINVVYGNLKLLKAGAPPARAKAMLSDALKAAEDARQVITEFRNFAMDTRVAEPADLNRCVEETLSVLRRDLAAVKVVRKLGRLPAVRGFHGQLNQVLLNLVKNAVEAMGGKGMLRISTRATPRWVELEVADSGRGIPAKDRAKIFEPFFTTKGEGRGMGLGLSISAAIVENHGGRIRVASRVGKGTTFTVRLPR